LIFLVTSGLVARSAGELVVDLTHPFDAQTIYWPTETGFVLQKGSAGFTERGYFYMANRFSAPEHGGTHIDAPIHFFKAGQTVDQIPLRRLVGVGVCVDVAQKCSADRDYLVTVEDLRAWEENHKITLEEKIVFISTGYTRWWPNRAEYLGTAATGRTAVSQLHFPSLDPAAATWLATQRRIKVVGIDTASIDHESNPRQPGRPRSTA
jgi:kynurenine formamidase